MSPVISSIIRWIARLCTVLILAVFLAFVAGEPAGSLRAIHLREWVGMVFLFGAIAAMLLAWKWGFPAALISLFALGAFAVVVHMTRMDVLAIAAIPNILFLVDWKLRRFQSSPIPKAG